MKLRKIGLALALAGFAAPAAHATDGYFAHGYGMKAKGMGGAATAVAQDAFGGANNPATMAFAGNRFDIGIDYFSPHRNAERSGTPDWLNGSVESGSTSFFIPELGYNYMLRPDLALGVTVYGNGGMNTNYPSGQISNPNGAGLCNAFQTGGMAPAQPSYNMLCGNGNLGVDLMQLMVAPYVAWKFTNNLSVGFAPLFAYQRFKAEGLQAFAGASQSPNDLTNNGYADSTGWGARLGIYGDFGMFSAGASYATKMSMGNFDKYQGLFAQQGSFDIPSNWALGVAFRPDAKWLIAADYMRIDYGKVDSIANQQSNINSCLNTVFAGGAATSNANCLGGSSGAGFGWKSVNVFKLGVQYALDQQWTLRAGYNYTSNPIDSANVSFNILAPGVVQNHITLGTTYNLSPKSEITGAFMYAFNNDVTGPSFFNAPIQAQGGQSNITEKIEMWQWSLGVQYSYKF
jgi:long-chain fatty acid transport protein